MIQEITSKKTSQAIIAKVHTRLIEKGKYSKDIVALDWGGGKYDLARDKVKQKTECDLLIYDPYNRDKAYNSNTLKTIKEKGNADIIIIANVLNVIKDKENRINTLKEAKKYLKKDGKVYVSVYNAKKSKKYIEGIGQKTTKGWQNCQPKSWYREEIESVFNLNETFIF
jgi:predicted GTPase